MRGLAQALLKGRSRHIFLRSPVPPAALAPTVVEQLLTEEEPLLELVRLPRREPRVLEQLDDLVSELPLFQRKLWRLRVRVQTTVNVRADASGRDTERLDSLVQLARSLEHRLEVDVVDCHRSCTGTRRRVQKTRGSTS